MADKLFKASAKNSIRWYSDGRLESDFYVIAPDLMSALVKADEIAAALRDRLRTHKSVNGLRIVSLTELGDVENGVVMEREPETESWVEKEARKLKDSD